MARWVINWCRGNRVAGIAWDVTVVDTLAASYATLSAVNATSTDEVAASRIAANYNSLGHSYHSILLSSGS